MSEAPAPREPMPVLAGASGGPYLRNAWYVAGWADGLGAEPQAKVFLEEPVALFRDSAGTAHAIGGKRFLGYTGLRSRYFPTARLHRSPCR